MVFAKIRNVDNVTSSAIYDSVTDMLCYTEPGDAVICLLPLTVSGSTYRERKENARELAIDFQYNNDGDTDYQLSYEEIALVGDFFEKLGKRYGLLREFRENCIC